METKKERLYNIFIELIGELSNESLETLAKNLLEYVANDKTWDKVKTFDELKKEASSNNLDLIKRDGDARTPYEIAERLEMILAPLDVVVFHNLEEVEDFITLYKNTLENIKKLKNNNI